MLKKEKAKAILAEVDSLFHAAESQSKDGNVTYLDVVRICDRVREHFSQEIPQEIPKQGKQYVTGTLGKILDFAMTGPDTFFKIQNADGDIVYTRDGAFKNLDNFLVDSNGNNVLNADNEPIELEGEFVSQIGVTKTAYSNLEKVGDNTYTLKDANQVEIFENNDNMIVKGAVEKSNVNSVTAMVELIDAQRRFEQSQKAIKTIDELNSSVIDKIGNNTK